MREIFRGGELPSVESTEILSVPNFGSSTWARTRDLRINSLQIEAYAEFYPILETS